MMLYTITWVFGGTAVGKKHFIQQTTTLLKFIGVRCSPAWVADGPLFSTDIVNLVATNSLLIRWQWGRDSVLSFIAKHYPAIPQQIILLTADPRVQEARAKQREGRVKWGVEHLQDEAQSVKDLATAFAKEHSMPFQHIDISYTQTLLGDNHE